MSRPGERGSAAVEIVLITPLCVALLLFVVLVGRLGTARGIVDAAARDAARAASTATSPDDARRAALDAAQVSTRTGGLTCRPMTVTITNPATSDATVTAAVSCVVRIGDLTAGLAVPGSQTLTSRFSAPLDPYASVR